MLYNYQYRLRPSTEQKLVLNDWLRICRYWYNRQLGERFDWWEQNRSYTDRCPLVCHLPALRGKPEKKAMKCGLGGFPHEQLHQEGSKSRRKLAKREAKLHQQIARSRKDHAYNIAQMLLNTGKKVFFHEKLNLAGLSRRNKAKTDHNGNFLPNGQSAKSGLNKSWTDAAFGQFFAIWKFKAEYAGALVIPVNPQYTSQLLPYKDEFLFTDCSIREHWDKKLKLLIDRDISAGINIKRVGLGLFPTLSRRKGKIVISNSVTNSTLKKVLATLRGIQKHAPYPLG